MAARRHCELDTGAVDAALQELLRKEGLKNELQFSLSREMKSIAGTYQWRCGELDMSKSVHGPLVN